MTHLKEGIVILLGISAAICLVFPAVWNFLNPEMTQMQVFLEWWWMMLVGIFLGFLSGWVEKSW